MHTYALQRSGDDGGLVAAGDLSHLRELEREVDERRERVGGLGVEGGDVVGRLVPLDVHAHGGADRSGARQPEDDARSVGEKEADALVG